MRGFRKSVVMFFFAVTVAAAFQCLTTNAQAQSSYFTARGCTDCHGAAAATCVGCHHHSGSLSATTNKTTSYSPGETVSITLTSLGARAGWMSARLYNQAGALLAISTGNQSDMGSSTTLPAVLSAPAPATPGTYTWRMAYFGNEDGVVGDVHSEKSVSVTFTVGAAADTTAPVVGSFTLPASATSLSVPVSALSASDNVAVTGYLTTTSATVPAASAAGWSATAPASVTAVAGSNTFYAWAKDAAGNVSAAKSATVVVTLPDTTAPVVGSFTLPASATALTVPVSALSASDNVAVTGYLITTSATAPAASAAGWSATAPASVTAVEGGNTLYAWAKDAAGNVSAAKSSTVVVTLPDTAAPVVGSFTLPASATALTVPVSALSASDNVAVTGYLITTSATAPAASAAGWSATAPASVTAVAGSNTFYAWAKDAAGNVSVAKSATVVVTLPDTSAPVIGSFTLPASATALTVSVSALAASDNVAVTGYLITTSATAPAATAAGWSATAPASVTAAEGSNTFYAWAKDAAGNVSAAKSATVVVTLPDTTAPVVGGFTLPASATSLTVAVSALSASDNVAVTGYLITTSATAPAASAAGWSATAPASVTAVAGSNTFYAWAKDAAGNVSAAKSATVVVTLPDTAAPVVGSFTLPASATSLTVPVSALSASDNVAVTGYLITTSATAPAASAAGWSATAPASVAAVEGANTFYAWAKDAAGNVSAAKSAGVTVTISTADTTKPSLTVSTLADGSLTNKVTLNVSGNAADAGGLDTVTVNGEAVVFNADGTFSTALNLVDGANVITVVASDKAGNKTTDSRTVSFDPTAPVLAMETPADNSTSVQSFVTVGGTVNENSAVSIKVNGGSAQSAAMNGTSFSATVNLIGGINTIDITATDLAGNVSSAKRTVTYQAPQSQLTLAVTNPAQDVTTRRSSMTLRGSVTDALGAATVTIKVNDRSYTPRVEADGTFRQSISFSNRTRKYTITVTAKDASGNTATVTRNVIYLTTEREHDDD